MYLDTAIIVKLFVREADSEFYAKKVDNEIVVTSLLAHTEFWSALLTKERERLIDVMQRNEAWKRFARDFEEGRIEMAPLTPGIFKRANRILEDCHPRITLRSLDALHLATCEHLQEWPLCTNDKRMRQAAALLKFPLVDLAT